MDTGLTVNVFISSISFSPTAQVGSRDLLVEKVALRILETWSVKNGSKPLPSKAKGTAAESQMEVGFVSSHARVGAEYFEKREMGVFVEVRLGLYSLSFRD